jgi:hypothetical protein
MKMFDYLKKIGPYFFQLRKLEDYLVFDVLFPNTWKLPKRFVQEDKFLNNGETEDGNLSLSFISDFTEEGVDLIYQNIIGIINFNLEREEKERLLDEKIGELKKLFDSQKLENLKELKFDINQLKEAVNEKTKSGNRVKPTSEITTEE